MRPYSTNYRDKRIFCDVVLAEESYSIHDTAHLRRIFVVRCTVLKERLNILRPQHFFDN